MKILVKSRSWMEKQLQANQNWYLGKYIISIFSNGDVSPFPDRFNILRLNFDDVSERDISVGWNIFDSASKDNIFFDEEHAKQIVDFIADITDTPQKTFYVHCDAGVSRSGAVGYLLNEYFNKFLSNNEEDYKFFQIHNSHVMPNPLVVSLLKLALFGKPFSNIEVNDYEYNEDGEKIDHIEKI